MIRITSSIIAALISADHHGIRDVPASASYPVAAIKYIISMFHEFDAK